MNDSDNDEARRKREINMFSAMAAGGTFNFDDPIQTAVPSSSKGTNDDDDAIIAAASTDTEKQNDTPSDTKSSTTPQQQQQQKQEPKSDDSSSLFSKAATNVENTGTFAMASPNRRASEASNSNLEAAVAALTGEQESKPESSLNPRVPSPRPHKKRHKSNVQIHSQVVHLHRPLFFGPILPPRVLQQTRQIVKDCMNRLGIQGSKENPPERLDLFPPGVLGLIDSIKTYGFDLSPFPSEEEDETSDFWRGNPYVKTIQPVWGDNERAERLARYQRQMMVMRKRTSSAAMILESLKEPPPPPLLPTAPPSLSSSSSLSTTTPANTMVKTSSVATASTAASTSSVVDFQTPDRDLFSSWARGEDDNSIARDDRSVASVKTSDSADVTDPNIQSPMNDVALFSQLARGSSFDSLPSTPQSSERALFTQMVRGSSSDSLGNLATPPLSSSDQAIFANWAAGDSDDDDDMEIVAPPVSEQVQFSKWARGEDSDMKPEGTTMIRSPSGQPETSGTFRTVVPIADDSDDDSLVGSEMKTKVGMNEDLNAALVSFAEDCPSPRVASNVGIAGSESITAEESHAILSELGQTTPGGRPLSNLELSNGCVPMYECDDPALPLESDLGIYETKEDQLRGLEQRRSQEIIEKHTLPNVFGSIACPNTALHPDDTHSWNSRSVPARRARAGLTGKVSNLLPVPESPSLGSKPSIPSVTGHYRSDGFPPLPPKPPSASEMGSVHSTSAPPFQTGNVVPSRKRAKGSSSIGGSNVRFGWWNIADDESKNDFVGQGTSDGVNEYPLLLPPNEHSADVLHVHTGLEPSAAKLRQENLPLSSLHPATAVASQLPFLSDRSPSFRYLQVDTKSIEFPQLGGEIEPLFCSLSIYHVETIASASGHRGAAPAPDLKKCGRITETLTFDVTKDQSVEQRCFHSLWPFMTTNQPTPTPEETTQGTQCGVFPISSNFNYANLYVVLVVHKVWSDPSNRNVYLNPVEHLEKGQSIPTEDLESLRETAAQAAERHGHFLIPFAFGVAPILQVFGVEMPTEAISRGVEVPLFQFTSGRGEKPIIDHIMVMLYPRADHQSVGIAGPALPTNGGKAMLVMRNFGYLGLHSVFNGRSTLARERLVDFTGELQARKTTDEDDADRKPLDVNARQYVAPEWHSSYYAEPTVFMGRNVIPVKKKSDNGRTDASNNTDSSKLPFYVQELAPIPLRSNPHSSRPLPPSGRLKAGRMATPSFDCEPYFLTAFCNELMCSLGALRNAPKGNIAIKMELCEVNWDGDMNAFVAKPLENASIHNNRRGPALVHESYSSCVPSGDDIEFMDEIKIKLPLLLSSERANTGSRLSILFTVLNIEPKQKRRWTEMLGARRIREKGKKTGTIHSVDSKEGDVDGKSKANVPVLGYGVLPLTLSRNTNILLENGLYNVPICFSECLYPDKLPENIDETPPNSFLLRKVHEDGVTDLIEHASFRGANTTMDESSMAHSLPEKIFIDGGKDSPNSSVLSETQENGTVTSVIGTGSLHSPTSEPLPRGDKKLQTKSFVLQVRIIVHSSIHTQNVGLMNFISQKTNLPKPVDISSLPPTAIWRQSRSDIMRMMQNETGEYQGNMDNQMKTMIASTISVCKPTSCPSAQFSRFFFRVMNKLLLMMVSGTGDASFIWANPAAVLPLRIHAFASFMQLLNSILSHLAKHGTTQLSGHNKLNMLSFGRLVSIGFDEARLFMREQGNEAEEPVDTNAWFSTEVSERNEKSDPGIERPKARRSTSGGRSRHFRSNSDNLIFSSDMGDLKGIPLGPTTTTTTTSSFMPSDFGDLFSDSSNSIFPNEKSNPAVMSSPDPFENSLFSISGGVGRSESPFSWRDRNADSKSDFQKALHSSSSDFAEDAFAQFGGLSSTGRRKYMTLPPLSTIREDHDDDGVDLESSIAISKEKPNSASDNSNDMVRTAKKGSKQFRVPKLSKREPTQSPQMHTPPPSSTKSEPKKTVTTDEEIFSAGTAFLDVIGENLGYSSRNNRRKGEENPHHRKTRSRCSIDWTLPDDGLMYPDGDLKHPLNDFGETTKENSSDSRETGSDDFDLSMKQLKAEFDGVQTLKTYVERIELLNKFNTKGRWFPYVYEVLIFQWVAVLLERKRKSEESAKGPGFDLSLGDYKHGTRSSVREVRKRASGVVIACAPVLFELIKKSLGWRLHCLSSHVDSLGGTTTASPPPLVKLDKTLLENLEVLIKLLTDACLDSRNFDNWDYRRMSIEINDSIILFLRDLFAFIEPESAHRLIMTYFSRFLVKEGKQWQDRDSKLGGRFSWEICKLRLNAITALVRFKDFVRVCSPQMLSWAEVPINSRMFFDSALESFLSLRIPGFDANDDPLSKENFRIPALKPHWLAELVVDICLAGTGHAEQLIQHRAASLLHELFWSHSQEGKVNGTSPLIASMYVSFLLKILTHVTYLSSLGAKTQLRKDLMPCVLYVLQCAPIGMLHACWRKLCKAAEGKGAQEKYGFSEQTGNNEGFKPSVSFEEQEESNIFDMFSLLNLVLSTVEYDGGEDVVEERAENLHESTIWRKEFLPAIKQKGIEALVRRFPLTRRLQREAPKQENEKPTYSSTSSRKWFAHDGSLVVVNTCRYIVREMLAMIRQNNPNSQKSPKRGSAATFIDEHVPFQPYSGNRRGQKQALSFSETDTIVFARAAASVYLHALALRQSDIVVIKTLTASVELVKIFGIQIFLEAVGETLQHWMRFVMMNCGSRRAEVRIQASEFLEWILRVTWDRYGSFYRVRQPLLAVQTEIMERIVATANSRYQAEQRRMKTTIQYLTNDSAEATLSMMWRTLDRLHHNSASQNVAFRSALIRLAQKLKKLYRAYIAFHALAILKRERSPLSPTNSNVIEEEENFEVTALKQSRRISVHRIITASAGFSKQFLGLQRRNAERTAVAHNEAVEDAFMDAANVFSSTELPSHRVAWLQKLAEFHASRSKFAEQATCHFMIYSTICQAARLHECVWSSMPFLPWTKDRGVHNDGEGPAGEPDDYYDSDYCYDECFDEYGGFDSQYGREVEKTDSFRRIFYRVFNSVRMRTGDWEIGGSKYAFYGVTLVSEYDSTNPWIPLRKMEEVMIEEAEMAGELYLQAGITESSRVAWGLATTYYAERYNYTKLAHAYRRLASVVSSHIPVVDTNDLALDFSHPLGRFYRVWFHGGAPDDLIGAEFIYRAPREVKLEEFGKSLSEVIRSILPENTPIDLVLDDGRPEEVNQWRTGQRRALGPAPLEPVKIKVTPLRPLLKGANRIRGTPEWFNVYTDIAFSGSTSGGSRTDLSGRQRSSRGGSRAVHSRSYSASLFTSGGSLSSKVTDVSSGLYLGDTRSSSGRNAELIGVDKFSFLQPVKKDRMRVSRDWLKGSRDFAAKSLRVTQLQVEHTFPACVARQSVVHRAVFTQSPLEAGVEAVCCWCSVLFRTAVATNGMRVLSKQKGVGKHGIGNAAAIVIADCIHSSRVKEMGMTLLKKERFFAEESNGHDGILDYRKLSEDEVRRLQIQLARGIVVFIELLHLLIARNRELLLTVMEARKQNDFLLPTTSSRNSSLKEFNPVSSPGANERRGIRSPGFAPTHRRVISGASNWSAQSSTNHVRTVSTSAAAPEVPFAQAQDNGSRHGEASMGHSVSNHGSVSDRTDSAIAVQSELQRSFISLAKVLHPLIAALLDSDTPKWLRQCTQDSYFSSYAYRETEISMANELCFFVPETLHSQPVETESAMPFSASHSIVSSAEPGLTGLMHPSQSPAGSMADGASVASRGSNNRIHRKKASDGSLYFEITSKK